jgi:hypothetical protein
MLQAWGGGLLFGKEQLDLKDVSFRKSSRNQTGFRVLKKITEAIGPTSGRPE